MFQTLPLNARRDGRGGLYDPPPAQWCHQLVAPVQLSRQRDRSAVAVQSAGSGSAEELQLQQQGGGNERRG